MHNAQPFLGQQFTEQNVWQIEGGNDNHQALSDQFLPVAISSLFVLFHQFD